MMLNLAIILHALLVMSIALRIIWRDNLTPVARLAWFIVILIIPYLGVIVYWMFGEITLGLNANTQAQQDLKRLRQYAPQVLGENNTITENIEDNYRAGFYYSQSVNGFYPIADNQLTLMPDAATTLKNMVADIDAATKQVHIVYYIFLTDSTGNAIAEALIRAVKRGVDCRVMVDAIGSRPLTKSDLWKKMLKAGVQLEKALPFNNLIKTVLLSRIDLRNHRKITIIDGKVTYCGSQNCADPEFRVKPKYAPWVDIMMRVEGPVVAQNQMLFASDWLKARPETPLETFIFNTSAPEQGNTLAAIYGDGPTERQASSPQLLSTLFSQTQSELIISTPYFVPDYLVLGALCAVAYRGVKVILILPKNNDSFVVAASSRSYYRQMLGAGIEIYEYKPGLLHAKTLTIDGTCAFIGSTNLDLRSFDLNYENNILIYDKATTSDIKQRQLSYISDSDIVDLDTVNNWSLPYRLWNNVIATIGPVL